MSRVLKEEDLTQRVAIYRMKYGTLMVTEHDDFRETDPEYVRMTEPVEVTFTPLPDETIVAGRVSALDAEIQKVRAETEVKINRLIDEKQRLLAITHQE